VSKVGDTATSIAAIVDGVTDSGVVYDYDPFPDNDWSAFVAKFTSTIGGKVVVRAWTVKNIARRTVPISIAMGAEVQRIEFDWLVRGFLGHNEAATTDSTFRDLLEAVTEALNANRSLAGVAGCLDHDPCDYVLPNDGALLSLGDTICHYGEVRFTSYHEQAISVT
jgi:hypothetical protein